MLRKRSTGCGFKRHAMILFEAKPEFASTLRADQRRGVKIAEKRRHGKSDWRAPLILSNSREINLNFSGK